MPEPKPKTISRRKLLAAGALTGLGVAGLGDFGSRDVVFERHELRLPRWDADGFRVAMLADMHLRDAEAVERARHATELAIAEKPDLILNVGDFVSKLEAVQHEYLTKALEPLHDAKCPCYAIMGNHDYGSTVPRMVVDMVNRSPMKMLVNHIAEVGGVTLAGFDDCLLGNPDWNLLRGCSVSHSLLSLVHEPDFVDRNVSSVSLQLSGHSHGGQICLPGGFPIRLPSGAEKYSAGYYPDAEVPLYVSRGIGTTGPKWRIFCPPELTILTLRGV